MTVEEHTRAAEIALARAEEEAEKSTVEGEEMTHLAAAQIALQFASVHVSLAELQLRICQMR